MDIKILDFSMNPCYQGDVYVIKKHRDQVMRCDIYFDQTGEMVNRKLPP